MTEPRILAHRYEIRELIGRGGMAEVYLGYDRRLSRMVAIKLLRADVAGDPTFQARFRREAQSAAALNHPAIVAVYDSGEEVMAQPDGGERTVPYIVMEYVEGHTVRELLREGEAVPIPEAIEITVGVLDALEYSHRAGIIHRDIKPGNIMLTSTGDVKVMDFGIARAVEDSAATVTQTHSVVGTAQYLSPEQARGEVVDSRSDLYSAGCLLYELLTGQPPFTGDSAVAIAYQHVREMPKPPSSLAPDIPESLDRVTLKSLAKQRDDRYQDAAHMRSDMLAAQRGLEVNAPGIDTWTRTAVADTAATQVVAPVGAPPAPPAAPHTTTMPASVEDAPERSSSRKTWLWILVIALLAGLGVVAGLVATGHLGSSPAPAPSPTQTAAPVPQVSGMTEAQAKAAIENAGLTYVKGDPVASDDIAQDHAVSTEPGAGTHAVLGASVTVHFSSGSAMVNVPDVSGKTQDEAKAALEEAGLKLGNFTTEDSGTVEKDKVIRTDPVSGTKVARQSAVSVVLSTGQISVPDLTGMSQSDARNTLTDMGLRVGDVSYADSSTVAQGLVMSFSPASGTAVSAGSEVDLVLSNGPHVPQVVGMRQDEAVRLLQQQGFTVSIAERAVTSRDEDGVVLAVSPGAGSVVAPGDEITLDVGKAEPAAPSATPKS